MYRCATAADLPDICSHRKREREPGFRGSSAYLPACVYRIHKHTRRQLVRFNILIGGRAQPNVPPQQQHRHLCPRQQQCPTARHHRQQQPTEASPLLPQAAVSAIHPPDSSPHSFRGRPELGSRRGLAPGVLSLESRVWNSPTP